MLVLPAKLRRRMNYKEIREAVQEAFMDGAGTYTIDGWNYVRVSRLCAIDYRTKHPEVAIHLSEDFLTGAIFGQYTEFSNAMANRKGNS
jgi:hypothetical protein